VGSLVIGLGPEARGATFGRGASANEIVPERGG
jgi:hypothetical protein